MSLANSGKFTSMTNFLSNRIEKIDIKNDDMNIKNKNSNDNKNEINTKPKTNQIYNKVKIKVLLF